MITILLGFMLYLCIGLFLCSLLGTPLESVPTVAVLWSVILISVAVSYITGGSDEEM